MKDPYASGKLPANLYHKKNDVTGKLVVVLHARIEDRGCRLIVQRSRCIRAGEVHELILTDQGDKKPGETVDNVAYLGFFAADVSGVIIIGDVLTIGGKEYGTVLGFDETHAPNHLNILLHIPERITGAEADLQLQSAVTFQQKKE
jgi:hypothetical protein